MWKNTNLQPTAGLEEVIKAEREKSPDPVEWLSP
jgi:hypothetical protein